MALDDQIVVTMASIPRRQPGLVTTVKALLPQCDRMIVCLNGYNSDVVSSLPKDDKLVYIWQPENIGPRGKFILSAQLNGYQIIVDDDIIYPSDYVYTMVQYIERFRRKVIIGLHGKLLLYRHNEPMTFKFYRYDADVNDFEPVHILGTGVMAFHRDAITIDFADMDTGKIDDRVGIMAQRQHVPMLVVPHKATWVTANADIADIDALHHDMNLKQAASTRVHTWTQWRLYTTDTNDIPNYF